MVNMLGKPRQLQGHFRRGVMYTFFSWPSLFYSHKLLLAVLAAFADFLYFFLSSKLLWFGRQRPRYKRPRFLVGSQRSWHRHCVATLQPCTCNVDPKDSLFYPLTQNRWDFQRPSNIDKMPVLWVYTLNGQIDLVLKMKGKI